MGWVTSIGTALLSALVPGASAAAGVAAAGQAVSSGLEYIGNAATEGFTGWVFNGMATGFAYAMTFWVQMPAGFSNDGGWMDNVQTMLLPIQVVAVTLSLAFTAVMAVAGYVTKGSGDGAERFIFVIVRTTFAASGIQSVILLLTRLSDGISEWIMRAGTDDPGEALKKTMGTAATNSGIAGLIAFLAIIGILSSLVQICFLLIRVALLALVTCLLPFMAAFSGFEQGEVAYKRLFTFIVGALIYKPLGAIIYYAIFQMGNAEDGGTQVLSIIEDRPGNPRL